MRLEHALHALRAEDAHQIVLQAQEELRGAGIALAARTAAQLIVDAPAFVAFGADDVEPARGQHPLLVGRDFGADLGSAGFDSASSTMPPSSFLMRMSALPPSWMSVPRPAMLVAMVTVPETPACATIAGLLLVIARVQHVVLDLALLQQGSEMFGLLDRDGADQHRLAALVAFLDQLDDGFVLLVDGAIDFVVVVDARDRQVGRNLHDIELVDVHEFGRFGQRGAGHAGELFVEAEIVLEGDRGQRHVFGLDLDTFLGFQRLVQAFGDSGGPASCGR